MKVSYSLDIQTLQEAVHRFIENRAGLQDGALEGISPTVILIDGDAVSLQDFIREITVEVIL